MDQEKIGNKIKTIRKENNLSQTAFASRLGVTPQAVSKWENGKNLPDISTLKEIKKEFNINIDEIIDGKFTKLNKSKTTKTILFMVFAILLCSLLVFFFFHFRNRNKPNEQFEFEEVTSLNTDFKVSGNVVKTNDRTSLIINDVIFTGKEDYILYEELTCNLYEEKENTKTIITSCNNEKNTTLTNYLENLKIRMDHYTENCSMFTETNLFIEINAINNNKTITYRIPIEIKETSCQ